MTVETISRPKAGGKTHEAILRMFEDPNLVFLAANAAHANSTFKRARAMAVESGLQPLPLTRFQSFSSTAKEQSRGRDPKLSYVVDNADAMLEYILGARVSIITVTEASDV